jgi:NAD(P)-dependent dehydrogenase (short-subunit alcohol dehydrogenase family)
MKELKSRTVLLTGAPGGIGQSAETRANVIAPATS